MQGLTIHEIKIIVFTMFWGYKVFVNIKDAVVEKFMDVYFSRSQREIQWKLLGAEFSLNNLRSNFLFYKNLCLWGVYYPGLGRNAVHSSRMRNAVVSDSNSAGVYVA